MGNQTNIGFTYIVPGSAGSTWNPIRAVDLKTHRSGTMCTKVSPGCEKCFASLINKTQKNWIGLEFPHKHDKDAIQMLQERVRFKMSTEGDTSIDWPLRTKRSRGIFTGSMTDWLGEFVPTEWAASILAVMVMAQHHVFLPLTKRRESLRNLFVAMDSRNGPQEISVPADRVYSEALVRGRALQSKADWAGRQPSFLFNHQFRTAYPWPPPNIFFGMSVSTVQEAKYTKQIIEEIRELAPAVKIFINQGPALDEIDWTALGYHKGYIDFMAWEGESDFDARPATYKSAQLAIDFCKSTDTPIFIKQLGTVLAIAEGLDVPKGEKIPQDHPLYVREFPDVSKSYVPIPQKK